MDTIALVNDTAALNRLIKSAATSGAKAGEALHVAAYNCLMLAGNTGDIRAMQRLHDAVNPASRKALAVWATTFGKFNYNAAKAHVTADKDAKSINGTFTFAKSGMTDSDKAQSIGPVDYAKAKKAPVVHTFDVEAFKKAALALIAKAEDKELKTPLVEKMKALFA